MQQLLTKSENIENKMSLGLQSRLLYLLLKCPLLQEGHCTCNKENAVKVSQPQRVYSDDEDVALHVIVPYSLRKAARAAHLNCSEVTRKALVKQLKKVYNK